MNVLKSDLDGAGCVSMAHPSSADDVSRLEAEKRGASAAGLAFNAPAAVENTAGGRTSPRVNSGAIAASSLIVAGLAMPAIMPVGRLPGESPAE